MKYNKLQVRKVDEKKVLHKVKKNWVVMSLASFALAGGMIFDSSMVKTTVSADTVGQTNETTTSSDAQKGQSVDTHDQVETKTTTRTIKLVDKDSKQEIANVEPIKQTIDWIRTNKVDTQGNIVSQGTWQASDNNSQYAALTSDDLDMTKNGYMLPQIDGKDVILVNAKDTDATKGDEEVTVTYTKSTQTTPYADSTKSTDTTSTTESTKSSTTEKPKIAKVNESSDDLQRIGSNQLGKFDVTDPDYPSDMWLDTDSRYYSFVGLYDKQTNYRITLSLLKGGTTGAIRVTVVDQAGNIVAQKDVAVNKNRVVFNPGVFDNSNSIGLDNLGDHGVVTSGGGGNRYQVIYDASDPIKKTLAEKSFFVPVLVKQSVSYVDAETGKEVIDEDGNAIGPIIQYGLTGQKYTTNPNPKVVNGQFLISHYRVDPDNAMGTMSQFGVIGGQYIQEFPDVNVKNVYTQINEDGTMVGVTYDNGQEVFRRTLSAGQAATEGYYQRNSGITFYLRNPYVPQTRNIVYKYLTLGKFIPVDKQTGKKIAGGAYDKQYKNDSSDPSKAKNPELPNIPEYGLVDENGNALINPKTGQPYKAGDRYPVSNSNNLHQDTILQYSKLKAVSVQYIDVDIAGNSKVLDNDDLLYGWPNANINYDSSSRVAYYRSLGYELVSSDNPTRGQKFSSGVGNEQVYTIKFKHVHQKVTPDNPGVPGQPVDPNNPDGPKYPDGTDENSLKKTIHQVIKYVDENGREIHEEVTETVTFERDAEFDEVTGQVNYGEWHSDKAEFSAKKSPVINGYYLKDKNQENIPSKQVQVDTADDNETVVYGKLGKLVPEAPDHKPIDGGQHDADYPNNPNDPTKPGNPVIPNIPGYTPLDPDKHPLKPGDTYPIDSNKPGDNTPIIYVKTDQHINIKYIDNATNETLKTDNLTGKPGEASDYSTSASILAFEKQGYELVVDGYPKDGVKFSTDDQDQNYTVTLKHVHQKVTPDNPGVPGQPVDPNNPDGPKYPDGTDEN
ncbi:mucin-binding protein, partial [Fructobacillus fructosus]|uniref:mucin-binding protein n=2 Tax=Fructobacillus fructosus TaxID=1631 RepID=UPI003BAD8EF2